MSSWLAGLFHGAGTGTAIAKPAAKDFREEVRGRRN